MPTAAALRSIIEPGLSTVYSFAQLLALGYSVSEVRSQLRARRWQRVGRAVITHNGPLSMAEQRAAALVVLGPRASLTSFTLLSEKGLISWERDSIHVLVPRGARVTRPPGLPLRIHFTNRWSEHDAASSVGRLAHATLLAAASFRQPRPACGLLAAVAQQRLARPIDLSAALDEQPRLRHRRALVLAAADIAQGAHALTEIDFARLCRDSGLPEPRRQGVRQLADGTRRFVDAEWRSRSGRRIVAEVDGALHLVAARWWEDQLRQNELVIAGDWVLRFPSVVFRHEQQLVVDQLARLLRT